MRNMFQALLKTKTDQPEDGLNYILYKIQILMIFYPDFFQKKHLFPEYHHIRKL